MDLNKSFMQANTKLGTRNLKHSRDNFSNELRSGQIRDFPKSLKFHSLKYGDFLCHSDGILE